MVRRRVNCALVLSAVAAPTPQVEKLLRAAESPLSREELQQQVGLADRKHFRETLLNPLIGAGWLAMTIPEAPNSRLQKYRLTAKGRAWLDRLKI